MLGACVLVLCTRGRLSEMLFADQLSLVQRGFCPLPEGWLEIAFRVHFAFSVSMTSPPLLFPSFHSFQGFLL